MSIRILSNELQRKSEKELNENPKRVQEDIKHIREWLAKEAHLHVTKDDQWLLNFLRGCKFSLQRTKEKLDKYYTMRSLLPEFYTNRDPLLPEIQQALECGVFVPLPKTTQPDGPRIILVRCEQVDPQKVSFLTSMKASLMSIEILLNEDDNFIIAGQMGLLDLKGLTITHAVQVTPPYIKKLVLFLQEACPSRPKAAHIINTPDLFKTIFNYAKPLLKTKILNRIHIYKEKESCKFLEIIESVLTKEYGGDGVSFEEMALQWKRKVESYRDWFLEDEKNYSNENDRIGEPKTSECMFGIAGSFRKLDID